MDSTGISVGLTYDGDLFWDAAGGRQRTARYLHLVSTSVFVNLDHMLGVSGGALYLSSFWSLGDNPSQFTGDLQGVDNIAAPNTWKIFNAQFRESILDGRLALLFGLYDVNSEFDVSERANLLLNPSFGIGPAFSQSGVNGPSVFPASAPAFRVQTEVSGSVTARAVVANGIAGDPSDPYGTHVRVGGGALFVAELDRHQAESDDRKLGVGSWIYTSRMVSVADKVTAEADSRGPHSYGFYLLADYPLWKDVGAKRELGAFGRIGHANPRANRVAWFVSGGMTARGLLSKRESDYLGVGLVAAFNGSDYKAATRSIGRPVENTETTLEATGLFSLNGHVTVQPDIQYVINPNTDPAIDNALVVFLRLIAVL